MSPVAAASTTRRRLERTALELFDRYGYDDVTTTQIAEAAGVSPRTFFRHFPTKVDALMGDWRQRTWEFVLCLHRQALDIELSHALVSAIVEHERIDPLDHADMLRARILRGTPSLAAALRAYEADLEGHFADWVAQRTGRSADDFEVLVTAAALVAARRVVMTEWHTRQGATPLVDLARRALTAVRAVG